MSTASQQEPHRPLQAHLFEYGWAPDTVMVRIARTVSLTAKVGDVRPRPFENRRPKWGQRVA
ncbi:hypothetical protein [Wenjunlia tyrosinilytica]|nr:hypothetical protein [Wenjunlia tyrosinilytica]